MPAGASSDARAGAIEDADAEVGRQEARGDAARRQAPQDRQVAQRVIEGAGRAGEHQLAGAAAQRLVHGQLAVRDVLAHRVADELDAACLRERRATRRPASRSRRPQRPGVTPRPVRNRAPPSAASRRSAAAGEGTVPAGVARTSPSRNDDGAAGAARLTRARHRAVRRRRERRVVGPAAAATADDGDDAVGTR